MPCHAIPYHTISYHPTPYHNATTPHRNIPYHTIPCHAMPYHTIPYHTILHHTTTQPHRNIPYHTVYRTSVLKVLAISAARVRAEIILASAWRTPRSSTNKATKQKKRTQQTENLMSGAGCYLVANISTVKIVQHISVLTKHLQPTRNEFRAHRPE